MNVLKLRGKMVEREMSVERLAEALDIDRATLYRKLKECERFTVGEAQKIKAALELTVDEAHEIFFD